MNALDRTRAALRHLVRAPIGRFIRWRERRSVFAHELAVCAIFREEAPFLDEWLEFHSGIGATHFYLYNNFSTDEFRTVLAPWIARGMVTLTDWPVPVGQVPAYQHCLKRARRECQWLALIDVDEFLFSPQAIDIRGILRRYTDLPGIAVWQAFFGTGGHVARPDLPVTEAYRRRAALSTRPTVKSIVNPRMVYKVTIHVSKYWSGDALDTSGHVIMHGGNPVLDVLRINHYWSRSMEDLHTKVRRSDASTPSPRNLESHLDFEKKLNDEADESILPIARAIKAARSATP